MGRRPDFFTSLRGRMWVEVKELSAPTPEVLIGRAWEEIQSRLDRFPYSCSLYICVSSQFDAGSAKRALALIRHALDGRPDDQSELYVCIPVEVTGQATVLLEWVSADDRPVRMFAVQSTNNKYRCPPGVEPSAWTEAVWIRSPAGQREVRAYEVLSRTEPARLTVQAIREGAGPRLASVGVLDASQSTTIKRIREAIDDAADQLSNAQTFKPAPGVVMLYNDFLGSDDTDLLRACLGDLTISIDPDTVTSGAPFFGRNGVLSGGKNASVSAVVYCSSTAPPIGYVNPGARYPVKASWLCGEAYVLDR